MFAHPFPTFSSRAHILRWFIVGQISAISQAENYLRRRCEKWIKRESNRRIRVFSDKRHHKREEFGVASSGQRTGSESQWFSRFNYYGASLLSETRRISVRLQKMHSQTFKSMTLLLQVNQASCETLIVWEHVNYARVTRISLERVVLYNSHEHDIIVK